jgi:hypothetical protein
MALAVVSEIWQNSETKILQLEFAKRLYLKEIIATTNKTENPSSPYPRALY